MEIQERMEEMVDPNEEGAVNRLDTIRTRLLDYFQFYDCHNSENRTSDNIGTGVGLDDEEDAEDEDSSTPSVEDPDVAAKDAPNLHEYYRKYKKAVERKNKKKKLEFELEVFVKDLDYLVMLACKKDAKTPPWMDTNTLSMVNFSSFLNFPAVFKPLPQKGSAQWCGRCRNGNKNSITFERCF